MIFTIHKLIGGWDEKTGQMGASEPISRHRLARVALRQYFKVLASDDYWRAEIRVNGKRVDPMRLAKKKKGSTA